MPKMVLTTMTINLILRMILRMKTNKESWTKETRGKFYLLE